MVRFPDGLVENTKKLFPEANYLHEAIENRDVLEVMGCLKQLSIPITKVTNEWFMFAIKNGH